MSPDFPRSTCGKDLIRSETVRLVQLCLEKSDPIDVETPLGDLGVDSLAALDLAGRLEERFGISLDPAIAYDHPTVAQLANHVEQKLSPTAESVRIPVAGVARADVAIIGLGIRLAGEIDTVEALWRALLAGDDLTVATIDPARAPRATGLGRAGLLASATEFDAAAFGISDLEASAMTATQRLILSVALEAIEHACIEVASLSGKRVGVFVGAAGGEVACTGSKDRVSPYSVVGSASASLAGRVSFTFGLRGPSVVVDTACSSSLVALHLARQSLLADECSLAIVASASLVDPRSSEGLSAAGALSASGTSTAYGATADGYVRGEGALALVLKPLQAAEHDDDPVIAVVAGTAINHDGRSLTMTAPNGVAQEEVIEAALSAARENAGSLSFVEGHGTGTKLGDPIEVAALSRVLAKVDRKPLPLGSIKANLGHLEAAAGLAGVVKAALALQARRLPPHRLSDELSTLIRWNDAKVRIPIEAEAVENDAVAGVSSFGLTGTNAHAVLRCDSQRIQGKSTQRDAYLMCYSAHSPEALALVRTRLLELLNASVAAPGDIERSLLAARSGLEFRGALIGSPQGGWSDVLPDLVASPDPAKTGCWIEFSPLPGPERLSTSGDDDWPLRLRERLKDVVSHTVEITGLLEEWGIPHDRISAQGSGIIVAAVHFGLLQIGEATDLFVAMDRPPDTGHLWKVRAPEHELRALIVALGVGVHVQAYSEGVGTIVGDAGGLAPMERVCRGLGYEVVSPADSMPQPGRAAALIPIVDDLARHLEKTGWIVSEKRPDAVVFERHHARAQEGGSASVVLDVIKQPVAGSDRAMAASTRRVGASVESTYAVLQTIGVAFCHGMRISPRTSGRRINLSLRRLTSSSVVDVDACGVAQVSPPCPLVAADRVREWTPGGAPGSTLATSPEQVLALLHDGFRELSTDPVARLFDCEAWLLDPLPFGTRLRCSIDDGVVRLFSELRQSWRLLATGTTRRGDSGRATVVEARGHANRHARTAWYARAMQLRAAPQGPVYDGRDPKRTEIRNLSVRVLSDDEKAMLEAPGWLMENEWSPRHWPMARAGDAEGPTDIIKIRLAATSTAVDRLVDDCVQLRDAIGASIASGHRWIGVQLILEPDAEQTVAGAALAALAKTASREMPNCRIQTLIAEADAEKIDCGSIFATYPSEQTLRYFGGRLHVPVLMPATIEPRSFAAHFSGGVVVTGWTGTIGRMIVERLLKDTSSRLLLIARDAKPADRALIADHLHRIQLSEIDVSGGDDLGHALSEFRRRFGDLAGVCHCAGEVPEICFGEIARRHFETAFSARVGGALNLHRLTVDDQLRFFIVCSSLAGTFGAPTLGAYAASAAALDGLVEHRRALGLPGSSIGWTTWEAGRLADRGSRWSEHFGSLPAAYGWALIGGIANDLGVASSYAVARPGWWSDLPETLAETLSPRFQPVGQFAQAPETKPVRLAGVELEEAVLQHAERLAGPMVVREWKRGMPTLEAGLDSLTLLELHRFIRSRGGIELSPTAMLDHPTFRHLSRHLRELTS